MKTPGTTPGTTPRATRRGFSLVEVMAALAIAGICGATAVATFSGSIEEQGRSKHEWIAFTIAQRQMELLLSSPKTAASLQGDTASEPGTIPDHGCDNARSDRTVRVDELGAPSPSGNFTLCWKVKAGSPSGDLRNIRVIVTYPLTQGTEHVYLQAIR